MLGMMATIEGGHDVPLPKADGEDLSLNPLVFESDRFFFIFSFDFTFSVCLNKSLYAPACQRKERGGIFSFTEKDHKP